MKMSGRERRLPPALERQLVRGAKDGDADARGKLIEAFLPLIASVARLYRHSTTINRMELMQDGCVGLLRALESYDPDRGTPFWAYATWWVRQSMQQLVAELTRPVVLSDRALRQLARLRDAHDCHVQDHGREPSVSELCARTGLTRDQIDHLAVVDRRPRPLEQPVSGDDVMGTFGDLIADPQVEGEYERVLDRIDVRGLAGLNEREREVVQRRYGLDCDEETLAEIGTSLGLSAERVRQIQEGALGKLRVAAGVPA
jgi:RNA polymerase sigma factor (sigma-70 family)